MSALISLPFLEANTDLDSGLNTGLVPMRDAARAALSETHLPDRRHEDWKYSARKIGDLSTFSKVTRTPQASEYSRPYLAKDNAAQQSDETLVVRIENGEIASSLQNLDLPQGLRIVSFAELSDAETGLIKAAVESEAKKREFEQINLASFASGLYVEVAENTHVVTPIVLEIMQSNAGVSVPRIFVHAKANSQLTVVEEYLCAAADTALCISHSDYLVGSNAQINSLRMNLGFAEHKLISSTRAQLKRDARFHSDALCLGAQLGRHDLRVLLQEPGAECDLNGVVVTKEAQHFDNHTCIEHIAPHCVSNENYRCIADDSSQIIFNGRIHIVPDAQKTLGAMSNKNLLLSSSAEIDSKPELEIYADDVKCAHGTTIGQLDEEEVYYLKTRGLSDEQARQMLTLGFVLEIVRSARLEAVAVFWESKLSELLSFQD